MNNSEEKSSLDDSLKRLDEDVIWDVERKEIVRHNLSSKLNQTNPNTTFGMGYRIRKFVIPVMTTILLIGILTTLFLSIPLKDQLSIKDPDESGLKSTSSGKNNKMIEISSDQQSEIKQIRDSGFDLRLPSYSPEAHTEIKEIVKNVSDSGFTVMAGYYLQEKNIFNFMQESLDPIANSIPNSSSNGTEVMKDDVQRMLEIDNKVAYITKEGSETQPLLGIRAMRDHHIFTITSYYLTEDELIKIAKSIEFSDL